MPFDLQTVQVIQYLCVDPAKEKKKIKSWQSMFLSCAVKYLIKVHGGKEKNLIENVYFF